MKVTKTVFMPLPTENKTVFKPLAMTEMVVSQKNCRNAKREETEIETVTY